MGARLWKGITLFSFPLECWSEAEVKVLGLDVGILLGGFGLQVDGVALYVDSLDGADEFAAAASYAKVGGGLRDGQASLKRHHVDSLDGTVLGAGSAAGAVNVDYADILVKDHAAGLGAVFLLYGKRFDGSGRADLAAQGAVIVAVALVKFHYRLHDATQAILHTGRLEYMAGALAYAQMA